MGGKVGGWVGGWVGFSSPPFRRRVVDILEDQDWREAGWEGGKVGGWVGGWVESFLFFVAGWVER